MAAALGAHVVSRLICLKSEACVSRAHIISVRLKTLYFTRAPDKTSDRAARRRTPRTTGLQSGKTDPEIRRIRRQYTLIGSGTNTPDPVTGSGILYIFAKYAMRDTWNSKNE
ncbi:hypothetical protein EVAR_7999_1 [Eumeta japonica]|uniref:Uncharacterized protein n=1 Tax=Eumeta variegata TaxID=151549 RepID=A0A4C1TH08_EUMVA|nr:hypothetical protein EVAR_7999_1 [Eumeta japonica]